MLITVIKNIALKIRQKWVVLLLLLLILAGAYLRLYQLSAQSYWADEGYTVNAVLSITEHGSTILDSGQNYPCPIYCYPTAFLVKIFGNNPTSYRLFSVLAGLIFIIVIFFIAKRLFNKKIALLSSFFITFSYWQIAWSRQARWYTLFSLFFCLALYFFYQTLYTSKNKYWTGGLTAVFSLLTVLTHDLGLLLPLIFAGWVLIDQLFIQKKFPRKKVFIIILGGIIFLGLFDIISNTNFLTTLTKNFKLYYVLPYYLSFYLRAYWLFIIFSLFAIFNKSSPYKKETGFFLFVFLIYLIPLSFLTNVVAYRYLFHLTPIFLILGSVGIWQVQAELVGRTNKIIFGLIILSLFFTVAGGTLLPQANYFLESDNPKNLTRPYYIYTSQPDWAAAYTFIEKDKKNEEIVISSHAHFNKIYLHTAGYWLRYNYWGFENKEEFSLNDREYYVGAKIIDDLPELKAIIRDQHGFIIFDYTATQQRIPLEILTYIQANLSLVFTDQTNSFSKIWVYRF